MPLSSVSIHHRIGDAAAQALPQLEVPNYDQELKFKGLETDFPCLSRL